MAAQEPAIAAKAGHTWRNVFWENFTDPGCLEKNFRHPMGKGKWKWDAKSNKEIHWEPACSQIVRDASCHHKPVLRVCVFSDWFHRIDRLCTTQKFGYGYYQARCRFQGAEGMHSAFWLLPDGMWDAPAPPGEIAGGVEVDVVEHRGRDGSGVDISGQGNTAVHWGGYGAHHRSVAYKQMGLPDAPGEWATFGVLHEPGGMKWYWNGREVNSARVWSPMPNSIFFSTEVNESGGWAGQDMPSYGPLAAPAGWIEVDHCGFWELARSSGHDAAQLMRETSRFNKEQERTLYWERYGEHWWLVPFPAGRVTPNPYRAETVLTLETTEYVAPLPPRIGEAQEAYATGSRLRCERLPDCVSAPEEGLVIDVTVRDA